MAKATLSWMIESLSGKLGKSTVPYQSLGQQIIRTQGKVRNPDTAEQRVVRAIAGGIGIATKNVVKGGVLQSYFHELAKNPRTWNAEFAHYAHGKANANANEAISAYADSEVKSKFDTAAALTRLTGFSMGDGQGESLTAGEVLAIAYNASYKAGETDAPASLATVSAEQLATYAENFRSA